MIDILRQLLDEVDPVKGFKSGVRVPYAEAVAFADKMKEYLSQIGIPPEKVVYGGSIRRAKADIGDLDIVLVDSAVDRETYRQFVTLLEKNGHVVKVRVIGNVHMSALVDGTLVELKKTDPEALGAMLLFATGSGQFNMGMRAFAKANGFALNQYGLFKRDTPDLVARKTEEEVFAALGLKFVPPQQRDIFRAEKIAQEVSSEVPADILAKLPDEVKKSLELFVLPVEDERGVSVPRDFLWNKGARQQYYKRGGRLKIPDELKLDRYL